MNEERTDLAQFGETPEQPKTGTATEQPKTDSASETPKTDWVPEQPKTGSVPEQPKTGSATENDSRVRNDRAGPGLLRSYDPLQVLTWWRTFGLEVVGSIGPRGYARKVFGADSMIRPAGIRRDIKFLAWLHVGVFFEQNIEWSASAPMLLLDQSPDCRDAFIEWYEEHPLLIVHTGDQPVSDTPQYESLPLAEALERYNKKAPRLKQRSYWTAWKAATEGHLVAWRPNGRWTTTASNIEAWVETESQNSKKSCDDAA